MGRSGGRSSGRVRVAGSQLVNVVLMSAIRRVRATFMSLRKGIRVRYRWTASVQHAAADEMRDAITSRLRNGEALTSGKAAPDAASDPLSITALRKTSDFVSRAFRPLGEKIVMRLLDRKSHARLTKPVRAESLRNSSGIRNLGMVLVTGTTGSGKTNTLSPRSRR